MESMVGKEVTMYLLKRRDFSLDNRCSLCGLDEENIKHLLVHCPMVWGLWTSLSAAVAICVPLYLIRDMLIGWKRNGTHPMLLVYVLLCLFWIPHCFVMAFPFCPQKECVLVERKSYLQGWIQFGTSGAICPH